MLVCGLTSDITTMAASRFVAGVAAGFGVFSIFLIVFDATEPEKRAAAGSLVWSGIGVAIVASGLASGPILDGGAWRLSFIVPAALALAVAVFIPRTASAARAQPNATRCAVVAVRRAHVCQLDLPRRGVFPFRRGLYLLRDLRRRHAEGNWPLFRGRYVVLGDVWSVVDRRRRLRRRPAVGRLRTTHRAERRAGQRSARLVAGRVRRELERFRGVGPGRTGRRRGTGDRHLPDPQQDERRGLSLLLYGWHRESWVSANSADLRSVDFSPTGSVHLPSAGSPLRVTAQPCLPPPPTASSPRRWRPSRG